MMVAHERGISRWTVLPVFVSVNTPLHVVGYDIPITLEPLRYILLELTVFALVSYSMIVGVMKFCIEEIVHEAYGSSSSSL
jgi:hypothetical protein